VINMRLPSLRERSGDIPALAAHFLARYSKENGKEVDRLDEATLAILNAYPFRGNVRELENIIERAVVMSSGSALRVQDLPPEVQQAIPQKSDAPQIPGSTLAD